MTDLLLILLAALFVLLNAFFVAAEFAIVKIRNTRVQILEQEGIAGKILARIHQQLDPYLSVCQLGITLASLGLGWIGEPAFAHILAPFFQILGVQSQKMIGFLSFFFAFGLISYLHIVVGELMPKSIAIRKTELIALITAIPLYLFYWIMYPAIWFLNNSANLLLKVLHLHSFDDASLSYSSEEIKLILHASHSHGEFSKSEFDLLNKSLSFTDLKITALMRPLDELISLDINSTLPEIIGVISKKQYSRYPVYKDNLSNIVGILHIKDFLPLIINNTPVTNIVPFIRDILKVNEDNDVLDVFHKFRTGKPHLAIVTSDTHSIGFVTVDNILRAIIGEIQDEFHITNKDWIKLADKSFVAKGSVTLFTLENLLSISFPQSEANTISGLIL